MSLMPSAWHHGQQRPEYFIYRGAKSFFEDTALHARVVAALRNSLAQVAFGG